MQPTAFKKFAARTGVCAHVTFVGLCAAAHAVDWSHGPGAPRPPHRGCANCLFKHRNALAPCGTLMFARQHERLVASDAVEAARLAANPFHPLRGIAFICFD